MSDVSLGDFDIDSDAIEEREFAFMRQFGTEPEGCEGPEDVGSPCLGGAVSGVAGAGYCAAGRKRRVALSP